jgi:drug/metabolite transporter (DMT)-like permease
MAGRLWPAEVNSYHSLAFIHLLMVICAALVATSFTVGAAIAGGLDPGVLTLVRFVLASVLLGPYVGLRSGLCFSWSVIWRCGLISASLVIFFWCMFLSLRYTSALNTSVIFTLVPSISGIYAVFLVGERLERGRLIALVCGMVGAVWVIFKGDLSLLLAMAWNKGDLIFLAGCFAMGLYTPLVRLLHRGEPMTVMTFWILATGSGWLLLIAGYRLFSIDWAGVPLMVWTGIGYLALFCTVMTFFLTQYAVPYIGPTRVMAYSYLYPGFVLVIDLILGHGWPAGSILPGIFLVLPAMFVIQRTAKTPLQPVKK